MNNSRHLQLYQHQEQVRTPSGFLVWFPRPVCSTPPHSWSSAVFMGIALQLFFVLPHLTVNSDGMSLLWTFQWLRSPHTHTNLTIDGTRQEAKCKDTWRPCPLQPQGWEQAALSLCLLSSSLHLSLLSPRSILDLSPLHRYGSVGSENHQPCQAQPRPYTPCVTHRSHRAAAAAAVIPLDNRCHKGAWFFLEQHYQEFEGKSICCLRYPGTGKVSSVLVLVT